jgi:hypothetical protein
MPEELSVVDRLAARLRLIAAELHDESVEVRTAHLDSEVERALGGMSSAERQEVIEKLRPMFPRLGAGEPGTGGSSGTGAPMDPETAIRVLEEDAASMSESERQLVATRLARAGYGMPGGRVGWSTETDDRLRQVLGIRGDADPDPDRVAALAAMLADALIKLDRASWAAWQEIAPRSRIRQRMRLAQVLSRFVEGDEDTPRVTTEGDLENTRMLAALLIGSMGHAGQAAWDHVRPLQPAEIEIASGARGKHRRLWASFEELAGLRLTAHALDGHMRSFIEKFVEEVMLGRTK